MCRGSYPACRRRSRAPGQRSTSSLLAPALQPRCRGAHSRGAQARRLRLPARAAQPNLSPRCSGRFPATVTRTLPSPPTAGAASRCMLLLHAMTCCAATAAATATSQPSACVLRCHPRPPRRCLLLLLDYPVVSSRLRPRQPCDLDDGLLSSSATATAAAAAFLLPPPTAAPRRALLLLGCSSAPLSLQPLALRSQHHTEAWPGGAAAGGKRVLPSVRLQLGQGSGSGHLPKHSRVPSTQSQEAMQLYQT